MADDSKGTDECLMEEEAEVEASCHFHLSFPKIPDPSEGVLRRPVAVAENRGLDGVPNFL